MLDFWRLVVGVINSQILLANILGPWQPLGMNEAIPGGAGIMALTDGLRLTQLGSMFDGYFGNISTVWADVDRKARAMIDYDNYFGSTSSRSSLPGVLSINLYWSDMKELVVFGHASYPPTCRPEEILGRARLHFLRSVTQHQQGDSIAAALPRHLFLSSLNRVVILPLHLPRVLLAQSHLATRQMETQAGRLPHDTPCSAWFVNEERVRFVNYVYALASFCGLLLMVAKRRHVKMRGFVLSSGTHSVSTEFDDESMEFGWGWYSLVPRQGSIPAPGQYEHGQGPDDNALTGSDSDTNSFDDLLAPTSVTSVSVSDPSSSSLDSTTTCSVDPASISLPYDDNEDTSYETALDDLVDPTSVPLPADNGNWERDETTWVESTGDLSLRDDILQGLEGAPQELVRPVEDEHGLMAYTSMEDASAGENNSQPAAFSVDDSLRISKGDLDTAANVSLDSCPMELDTTAQDDSADGSNLDLETTASRLASCMEPTSTGLDGLDGTIDMDISVELVPLTDRDNEDTQVTTTEELGHNAKEEEQVEIRMDTPRAGTYRSDFAPAARAHLVPSESCPAALPGSVLLVRPTSPPVQAVFTSSVSSPRIPLSESPIPALELEPSKPVDFQRVVGSQTCPNIALEAGLSSSGVELNDPEEPRIHMSRSVPEAMVVTGTINHVLDEGVMCAPFARGAEACFGEPASPAEAKEMQENETNEERRAESGNCESERGVEGEDHAENAASSSRPGQASDRPRKESKSPSNYRHDMEMYDRLVKKYEGFIEDIQAGRPVSGQGRREKNRNLEWFEKELEKARQGLRKATEGLVQKEAAAAERAAVEAAKRAKLAAKKAEKAAKKRAAKEAEQAQAV